MSKRTVLGIVLTMCVLIFAGTAAAQDKIQNLTNDYVKQIDDITKKKETDLMKV